MRLVTRLSLSLTVVGLLAAPALAQNRQPRQQQGSLLTNKSVQEELKLSEDQAKKAGEIDKSIGEKRRAEMEKLTNEERRGEKGRELIRKFNEEANTELGKVLKPEQQTRYKQIQFQQTVRRALSGGQGRRPGGGTGRPRTAFYEVKSVADAMNFTDAQKEKLKALNEENTKKIAAARQDAGRDFQKIREATTKVVNETLDEFKKVLDDTQKKKWEELSGKPFTVRFEQRRTDL
jgi:hypothetical protein